MRSFVVHVTGVVLVALVMVGCGGEGGDEVAFEVVADESDPAIERPHSRMWVVHGAEVAVAGIAREQEEVKALWELVGFGDEIPSLADQQALLVVAGGQTRSCPWDVEAVTTSSDGVAVHLAEPGWEGVPGDPPPELEQEEGPHCGVPPWEPRAIALTVPADQLPPAGALAEDQPLDLVGDPLQSRVVTIGRDGPEWNGPDDAYAVSAAQSTTAAEPTRLQEPPAVTSLPGFDVIQIQYDWHKYRGGFSAAYVTDPPVDVDGDAFLRIRLHNTAPGPLGQRRLDVPALGLVTDMVRVPDDEALTWILGIDGGKTPLATWTGHYNRHPDARPSDADPGKPPEVTGPTRVIAVGPPDL